MKLLVALDTYVPATISGALQMHDLCRELTALGHEVLVLVPDAERTGEPYVDHVDGVTVLRVATPRYKDENYVKRTLVEAMLPWYLYRGLKRSNWRQTRWDGLVWYSPTIFLGPLASKIRRACGARTYLVLRDIFPDWAVDMGLMRKGLAYQFLKRVERYQYRQADVIGVQTPANIALVQRELPAGEAAKIQVFENWLNRDAPAGPATELDPGLAGKKIVVYTGNMGTAQGMDNCLAIARHLADDPDIAFLFVGRGSEAARIKEAAQSMSNVYYVDEIASERVPGILERSCIGLIALDHRHSTHNIPGKMLTYVRSGLPVVAAVNPNNDLIPLVNEAGIGFAADCRAHAELAAAIRRIANDESRRQQMSQQARTTFLARFDVRSAAERLTTALRAGREIVAAKSPGNDRRLVKHDQEGERVLR